MSFIADLHVHSHFSLATSKQCTLEGFQYWAQIKGVRVVGTGDFTHPVWFEELRRKLKSAEPGLFQLKDEFAKSIDETIPLSSRAPVSFMITGEISSIYSRGGGCRKVHSLVFCPDFRTADTIRSKLERIGNIKSDGRPILGLDPRNLLEIVLESNPNAFLIPAHIWTPWFSMLGSKSGFDSVRACFGDLTPHIFAVETGLSSDPPMNRRVSFLDPLTLVSNSDLHSPGKMARNACIFHGDVDFFSMARGLRETDSDLYGGTIDLFPEEGKYFLDGHRKCGVSMAPERTKIAGKRCPKCGQPLVLGVLHRVSDLADRGPSHPPGKGSPKMNHETIIPLPEILSELLSCSTGTKKVNNAYFSLITQFGPELDILRRVEPNLLFSADLPFLGEAITRLRQRRVIRHGGYDGKYGIIRLFDKDELLQA